MSSVTLRSARTSHLDPKTAAAHLLDQLGNATPKLMVMFGSRGRDHVALNQEIRARIGHHIRFVGASTQNEIDNEGVYDGHVVIGALYGDLEVGTGLGRGLASNAIAAGSSAVAAAAQQLGMRPEDLDTRRHVGLVIDDGFRFKKEELLLGMLEANDGLVLVGGGAADSEQDPAKQSALVHADGEVATDAVLIALIRTDAPWAALRSHCYHPTGEYVTITKVDETHTRALEIDGKPAATRYSEIIGCPVDELEFPKLNGFVRRPTALKVGYEYFIRTPWKPLPDRSILFANLLEEGVELELMQLGDISAMTKQFFEQELPSRVRSPKALLAFQCSGRQWYADLAGKRAELARTFASAPPCAGMNCFFELYRGFHVNTTLTALAFGDTE